MRRTSSAQRKLHQQNREYALDLRYQQIAESVRESLQMGVEGKRFGIIAKLGIRADGEIRLSAKVSAVVRFIRPNGMVVLGSWDEIDPLRLEQA